MRQLARLWSLLGLAVAGAACADLGPDTGAAVAAVTVSRAMSTVDAEYPGKTLFDGAVSGTVSAPGNVGYGFTPLMDGFVTGLGGYWNGTATVRIYEVATGRVVAQVDHRSTLAYSYTAIEPVALVANVGYRIAVMQTGTAYKEDIGARARQRNHVRVDCLTTTGAGMGSGSGSGSGAPPIPACGTTTLMIGMPDLQFTPAMLSDCELVPNAADGNPCAPWNEVRLGAMMDGSAFAQNNTSPTGRSRWVRGDFVRAGASAAIVDDLRYPYATSAAVEYFIGAPWPVGNGAFDTTVIDPNGARRVARFGLSYAAAPVKIWSAGPTAQFVSKKLSNLENGVAWRQERNYVPYLGRPNLTTTCTCSEGSWVVGRANTVSTAVGRCAKQACGSGAETWEAYYFDYRDSCQPGPLASIDVGVGNGYTGTGYVWGDVYQQDYSVTSILETATIRCNPVGSTALGACMVWDSSAGPARPGPYQYCRVTRAGGGTLDYCQIPETVSDKNVCQRFCQYAHGALGNMEYGDDAAYEAWRNRPCTATPAPDPVVQAAGGYSAQSCTRSALP